MSASKAEKLKAGAKRTSSALFTGMEQRAAGEKNGNNDVLYSLDSKEPVSFIQADAEVERHTMLSGRISADTSNRWRAYTDATKTKPNTLKGIPANILLERAIIEFMDNHTLQGEQGKRYQANMKA